MGFSQALSLCPVTAAFPLCVSTLSFYPAGKECDLNRQCGVVNPDTKKICTRLLTCKVSAACVRLFPGGTMGGGMSSPPLQPS